MNKIVFTNGTFEILHPGHLYLLNEAAKLGNYLIVGLNSDKSFKLNKKRDPIFNDTERKNALLNLKCVNDVHIFNEKTPLKLIESINIDVLVKGDDWSGNVVGSKIVKNVVLINRLGNYSTTNLIKKIKNTTYKKIIDNIPQIKEHNTVITSINEDFENIKNIENLIKKTFEKNKTIFICGNGGSAADAQHLAAEFIEIKKAAIALTTDTSVITSISNDNSFNDIFSKQLLTLAKPNDLIIFISTSGRSKNILNAAKIAYEKINCNIVGLTGKNYSKEFEKYCTYLISINSENTQRIQEAHQLIYHIWYESIKGDLKTWN